MDLPQQQPGVAQNPMCVMHEKTLDQILTKLDTLALHQATTTASMVALQREMETGFRAVHKRQDVTNGRIDKNENAIGRLEEKMSAQDYFAVASSKDRAELWEEIRREADARIAALAVERDARQAADGVAQREIGALAERVQHHEGYAGGIGKASTGIWIILAGVLAALGWLVSLFLGDHPTPKN